MVLSSRINITGIQLNTGLDILIEILSSNGLGENELNIPPEKAYLNQSLDGLIFSQIHREISEKKTIYEQICIQWLIV